MIKQDGKVTKDAIMVWATAKYIQGVCFAFIDVALSLKEITYLLFFPEEIYLNTVLATMRLCHFPQFVPILHGK